MLKFMRAFCGDEQGATAIEYGLIATFIGLAAIVSFGNVGGKLKGPFNEIANNLAS